MTLVFCTTKVSSAPKLFPLSSTLAFPPVTRLPREKEKEEKNQQSASASRIRRPRREQKKQNSELKKKKNRNIDEKNVHAAPLQLRRRSSAYGLENSPHNIPCLTASAN
jgi:hypothetical protein